MKQFILVSYDICNDKRRRKIVKIMEDFGRRVQYSVFECYLKPVEYVLLKEKLTPHVRKSQDSIRFYFIGAEDIGRIVVLGKGEVTKEALFFIQ